MWSKWGIRRNNAIEIHSSNFDNITGGSLSFESSNKNRLDLPTKVRMVNVTADGINSDRNSFIEASTGSELEIIDSKFCNIF
jgi:hypothetical protein